MPECQALVDRVAAELAGADSRGESAFQGNVTVAKDSRHSYSGLYSPPGEKAAVFVKCYRAGGLIGEGLALLHLSRPYRVYRRIEKIAGDFPAPAPLALVRNQSSGNVYYFSTYLAGYTFAHWLEQNMGTPEEVKRITHSIGCALAALHTHRWCHGDFKWTNILIGRPVGEGAVEAYFIDLDAVGRLGILRGSRGRDIARFIVNAEDNGADDAVVQSFLEGYAGAMGESVARSLSVAGPSLDKLRRRHRRKYGPRQ